jgi:hypothetical protein
MTALPQIRPVDTRQTALQEWARRAFTTAVYLVTAGVSIALALVFGTDIWRIALSALLVVLLVACLVGITLSAASFFRDDDS